MPPTASPSSRSVSTTRFRSQPTGSTAPPTGVPSSFSGGPSPTPTRSTCSSSGTGRSRASGRSTGLRRDRALRSHRTCKAPTARSLLPRTDYILTIPGVDVHRRPAGRTGRRLPVCCACRGNSSACAARARVSRPTAGWAAERRTRATTCLPATVVPPTSSSPAKAWCGKDKRGNVRRAAGDARGRRGPPAADRQGTGAQSWVIHSCQEKPFVLPTPASPWLVEVTIDPTFSPAELDPTQSDPRQLGAMVSFSYERRS